MAGGVFVGSGALPVRDLFVYDPILLVDLDHKMIAFLKAVLGP